MTAILFRSLAFAAAATPSAAAGAAAQESAVAITHVTVIDPTAASAAASRSPDRTVLIAGGRITQVGPSSAVAVPDGYRAVDGRGGYLVPGYWDMHVHFNRDSATAFRVMGPLMIAHGVTSVRDLWSDCWEPCAPGRKALADMRAWQAAIARGDLLAPRFQALSSPIVHGPFGGFGYPSEFPDYWRPRTREEGAQLARYLHNRGSDFIKVFETMPSAGFFGLMEEAKRLGLPVVGHLPWSIHPIAAARAGLNGVEHARIPVMACVPEYESQMAMNERMATVGDSFQVSIFRPYRAALVAGFDGELCRRIFEVWAETGLALDPTHLTREMDARADEPEYRDDPRPAQRFRSRTFSSAACWRLSWFTIGRMRKGESGSRTRKAMGRLPPRVGTTSGRRPKPSAIASARASTAGWSAGVRTPGYPASHSRRITRS